MLLYLGTQTFNGIENDNMSGNYNLVTGVIDTLRYYALSLTKEQDKAEDLLQESLLRIITKIDLYRNDKSFEAWTKKVMLNVFRNGLESNSSRSDLFVDSYEYRLECLEQQYAAESDCYYNAKELLGIVGNLPGRQHQVIVLRMSGYKYDEIAAKLGISMGNVKNAVSNARANIKRMMEQ